MLAYNVIKNKVNIPIYTEIQIRSLNSTDRKKLAKKLGMKGYKVDNIIKILGFIDKLNALLFEQIDVLYDPLLLKGDIDNAILLLKAKSSLKMIVKNLLFQIIKININNKHKNK